MTYTGSVGLVQYADVLIGISRRGATCSYQAVRAGEPLWHTSLDCSVLGAPFHPSFDAPTVYRDRLFVSYDGRRGVDRVASVDTATGWARLLDVGPLGSDSTSARHLYLLPQAIVRQDGRHLSGLSVSATAVRSYSPMPGCISSTLTRVEWNRLNFWRVVSDDKTHSTRRL